MSSQFSRIHWFLYPFSLCLFLPALISFIFPHFTYGNHIYECDSWLYFSPNFILDQQVNRAFSYAVERLPGLVPSYHLHQIFSFPIARYASMLFVFSLCVFSVYYIVLKLFSQTTAQLISLAYALSPLLYGALDNDYIASDAEAYSLVALAFVVGSKFSEGKSRAYISLMCGGVFYALALLTNFKIGLYSFTTLILIGLCLKEFSMEKQWEVRYFLFLIGGLIATGLTSLYSFYVLGGELFFFNDHIQAIFKSESEFRRPLTETLQQSPAVLVFSMTAGLTLYLTRRQRPTVLNFSLILVVIFNFLFLFLGGNGFVTSNYIWSLLPLYLLLAEFLYELRPSRTQLFILFGCLIVTAGLFFPLNFNAQDWLSHYLGHWTPLILFLVGLGLPWRLKHARTSKIQFSVICFVLFSVMSFLRPDLGYGRNLWISPQPNHSHQKAYDLASSILKSVYQLVDSKQLPHIWVHSAPYSLGQIVKNCFQNCNSGPPILYPIPPLRLLSKAQNKHVDVILMSQTLEKPEWLPQNYGVQLKWMKSTMVTGPEPLYLSYGIMSPIP